MAKIELQLGNKTYNKAWVDNFSVTSQITSDGASAVYGVVPSTGTALLRDIDGSIQKDVNSGALPFSNAKTKIRINDIQSRDLTTNDSDYNIIDKELNLDFSDRLSLLDSTTYAGLELRETSMTVFEMLDDVIGSYGGYVKTQPINWVRYHCPERFGTVSNTQRIDCVTDDGWEVIGTPIQVIPNESYTLKYKISNLLAYNVLSSEQDSATGVKLQILSEQPKQSNCKDIAITSVSLPNTVKTVTDTLTFTPKTRTVYLVLNFGYAEDGQTLAMNIADLSLNGKSIHSATKNKTSHRLSGTSLWSTLSIEGKLSDMVIKYPYLEQASYRETIEKFCNLAQITFALDDNGDICFYGARPEALSGETVTSVPKHYQISNLNKTLFLKNKYDGVEIKQSNVNIAQEKDVAVYNNKMDIEVEELVDDYTILNGSVGDARKAKICDVENVVHKETYDVNHWVSLAGLTSKWLKLKLNIAKSQETGTLKIRKVYNKINSEITFLKRTTPCSMTYYFSSGTFGNIKYGETKEEVITRDGGEPIVKVKNENFDAYAEIQDKTAVSSSYDGENDIEFDIEAQLYAKTIECSGAKVGTGLTQLDISGNIEEYIPQTFSYTINGDCSKFSFEAVDLSSINIENATTIASIPTSELMQNEEDIEAIKNNILCDYGSGVPTATVDLFYGVGGSLGDEMTRPNDLLSFSDDDGLWRVTSRTLTYDGAPTISLEVQKQGEPIRWYKRTISADNADVEITRVSSNMPSAFIGVLSETDILYYGDEVSVKVVPLEGYSLSTVDIGGDIYTVGGSFSFYNVDGVSFTKTITKDLAIVVETVAAKWEAIQTTSIAVSKEINFSDYVTNRNYSIGDISLANLSIIEQDYGVYNIPLRITGFIDGAVNVTTPEVGDKGYKSYTGNFDEVVIKGTPSLIGINGLLGVSTQYGLVTAAINEVVRLGGNNISFTAKLTKGVDIVATYNTTITITKIEQYVKA